MLASVQICQASTIYLATTELINIWPSSVAGVLYCV